MRIPGPWLLPLLILCAAGAAFAAALPGRETPPPELQLPASFRGTLPCADCPGIRYHLDLWPDHVFHLRQEYLGRDRVFDDMGRWRWHPSRPVILLHGGREMPLEFEVLAPDRLRQLDVRGRSIESDLDYELVSDGSLVPTELRLPMSGLFSYLADAPGFQACRTGRFYPVAMEGPYLELERAYLAAPRPEPGAGLLARVEGTISQRPGMEGDALVPTLTVTRFRGLYPGQRCEPFMATASLVETYWKLLVLDGAEVEAVEHGREPHLILRRDLARFRATVGCNRLSGSYALEGDAIRFGTPAGTRMACPPPLDALEARLAQTLAATRRWAVEGRGLELRGDDGRILARFEAVYLF